MTLLWPWMLWLALVPPVAIVIGRLLQRFRQAPEGIEDLPHILKGRVDRGRLYFGSSFSETFPWRLWIGFLLVVLALARPQFGEATQSGDASGEVVIALDLSRSMLVRDIRPSRLERARTLAVDLVDKMPGQRIGLVGFAGAAYLLAPPNEDHAIVLGFLPTLNPDHIAAQGSDFAVLLDVAASIFSQERRGKTLIILSDGEAEQESSWRGRLGLFRSKNIRVISVGLGTVPGGPIPGQDGAPLRDRGGTQILSRLNTALLGELAKATDGRYLENPSERDLIARIRSTIAADTSSKQAPAEQVSRADQFPWFLGVALMFLIWSATREWTSRPRIRRGMQLGVAGVGALLGLSGPVQSQDSRTQQLSVVDMRGIEEDPLEASTKLVSTLIAKSRLDAGDYQALAETAIRYGEVHRGHGHALADGVLRDGLAAVMRGRRLDPKHTDWQAAERKLERLLEPPPPVPEADDSPPDPANEPVAGTLQTPIADNQQNGDGKKKPGDPNRQSASGQDMQTIGGGRRDVYDPAEWQDASLVQPLSELEKLRASDSPAELFRLMQHGDAREREQYW